MIKGKTFGFVSILLVTLLVVSCGKDNGNPTIRFVTGPEFTGKDTVIRVADTLPVTIEVKWNGADLLEVLDVREKDLSITTFDLDGEEATFTLNLVKGTDQTENWSFIVIDVDGNQASVSLTLTKDPNSEYGAIRYYSSVVLGAQNNIAKSAFISFQSEQATTFNLDQAFVSQAKIDFFFYYNETTKATLAGPGSNLPPDLYPGSRSIDLWTIKRESRFLKSTMTAQDFNAISNDSKLIKGWLDASSVLLATELKPNDIWLVKTADGKLGAVLVKQAGSTDTGEIEFAIKIQ
jgi:hypothetical protein